MNARITTRADEDSRGGKSPAIVFEDADLPSAAKQLAYSILMNAGQAVRHPCSAHHVYVTHERRKQCIASSRVYVQSSIIKEFLGLYQSAIEAQASVIGSAHDEKTTHGPQVDRVQHEKIKKYLEVGKTEGKVLFGGSAPDREVRVFLHRSMRGGG